MTEPSDEAFSTTPKVRWTVGLFRLLVFAVVLFGSYVGLQIAVFISAHRFPAQRDVIVAIGFAALSAAMLGIYVLLVRLLERRRPDEIALASNYAIGATILGAALFAAVYAILGSLGVARFVGVSRGTSVIVPLAIAIGAAFGEELTFRGGIFRVIENSFGTLAAVAVSAVLFGLVHGLNPGATVVSTAAIALEAGVLLGLAYAATRNLWFPIGLHFGWNFTEGGIFSAAVSGHATNGLVHVSLSGSELLTGGAFGPEASIVAVAVSLLASVALAVVTIRRGRWRR
jgi:membrane protease YdiL (CAAX protease family)